MHIDFLQYKFKKNFALFSGICLPSFKTTIKANI